MQREVMGLTRGLVVDKASILEIIVLQSPTLKEPFKVKEPEREQFDINSLMQLSFSGTFKTGASEQVCTITVTTIIPGVQNNHLLSGSEAVISSQTKVKT